MRGEFDREGLGEQLCGGFGGVVVGEARFGDEGVLRGHGDDAAGCAVGGHVLGDALGQEEDRVDVDLHDPAPALRGDLVAALQGGGAGVVDEDVEGPEVGADGIGEAGELFRAREVLLVCVAAAAEGADLSGGLLDPLGAGEIDEDEVRPGGGEAGREGTAEAAGRAGDQGGASGEVEAVGAARRGWRLGHGVVLG